MAGEVNQLMNAMKGVMSQVIKSANLMDFAIGTVISEEYKPLQIQVEAYKHPLTEDDLILTNAVKDHWLDIEVYWQTVDDNGLSEFQKTFESNVDNFNAHKHGDSSNANKQMSKHHTSHLHNIQGRKKIRVYNGLHTGEIVLLFRCGGGQQFIVLDRLTPHIVGGEWRTSELATIDEQITKPFEVTEEKVLTGWIEEAKDESKWQRFSKPETFNPGGNAPEQ